VIITTVGSDGGKGSGGGDLLDIVWLLLKLVGCNSPSYEGSWNEVVVTVGGVGKEERWFVVCFDLLLEWDGRALTVDE